MSTRACCVVCMLVLHGCSQGELPAPRARDSARVASSPPPALVDAAPMRDDALCGGLGTPQNLDQALAALREKELGASADAIARRVAQRQPKMKLFELEGYHVALELLAFANDPDFRALAAVMQRSVVELARAVHGRSVGEDEAKAIARYLVRVTDQLAFERLHVFDENHSHVTGRDWQDIDYTGEGMTWQGQRDYWAPRGVKSFKRAAYIHAYFVGAEKLAHWKRVYKPRGRMAGVAAP